MSLWRRGWGWGGARRPLPLLMELALLLLLVLVLVMLLPLPISACGICMGVGCGMWSETWMRSRRRAVVQQSDCCGCFDRPIDRSIQAASSLGGALAIDSNRALPEPVAVETVGRGRCKTVLLRKLYRPIFAPAMRCL